MDGVWVILKVLWWHLFGEIQYEILGTELGEVVNAVLWCLTIAALIYVVGM